MGLVDKAGSSSPWMVRRGRPDARLRLFCFPFSGGGAAAFRLWAEGMPAVEVCALQPPGRENRLREPPFTRMEPLVAGLVGAVRPLLDRPFAFFGHSLGAFLAFETARAFRRDGAATLDLFRHLFASGCPAPRTHTVPSPLHTGPDAGFVDELRRGQGTPEEVLADPELMEMVLPVLRADFTIYETYQATDEPPLDVPLTVLGGLHDHRASREQLQGWSAETRQRFALRMFPGGHLFVQTARAEVLRTVLGDLAPYLAGPQG